MTEVSFLFDHQLIAALEKLIRNSKNKLLLVSPYIDLDARIQDALAEKLKLHNFELQVLFGKNENNYLKSIKKNSLEFFKQFPNIEIRYSDRLHAKYFQNDFEYIITSLNLYDYSLANNIEVGVYCQFAKHGLVGKAINVSSNLVNHGIDKIDQDVLGNKKEENPIEKFNLIFSNAELKFKTSPKISDKAGVSGFLGGKKLDGYGVVVDNLKSFSTNEKSINVTETTVQSVQVNINLNSEGKKISASQLSKKLGVTGKDISSLMQRKGFIEGDRITNIGLQKGLVTKTYMGNDYIAFPEDLAEWEEL